MQKQHARLRGDGHPGLVGHLQAAAPFKVLLRQKHLDVPDQFLPVLGRQACHVGNVLLDERAPLGRKWAPANRIAAPTPQPSEHGR
jgi:ubiquinone biosynthesis protein UbiJ